MFPILHHYEASPFSEKIRRILAFKRIQFHSVRSPAVMPKPDLVALTGGYRRVPVLQMGNHVYCDTALIARVLERIQPSPTLYPSPLAEIIAEWADTSLFAAVAPIGFKPTRVDDLLRLLTPEELAQIREDRATMHNDAQRGFLSGAAARSHVPVYLERIDGELGLRDYLCGTEPSIADFSVYHSVWFLEMLAPEPLARFANLKRWAERIRSTPEISGEPLSSHDALDICRRAGGRDGPISGYMEVARPSELPGVPPRKPEPPGELARGQRVSVRATDYGRDPVEGEVVSLTPHEISLQREDERAGTVIVHFPRVGYEARGL